MNVDRWMRKISKMEFKHTKLSQGYIKIENQYKALRETLQKLKPSLLWFQGYDQSSSYTKSFKTMIGKVSKSKSSTVEEKTGNYLQIGLDVSENEDNLENIQGLKSLNETVREIDEKKRALNSELTLIIQRIEEALNACKQVDLARNECKDMQYKSEKAYQKNEDYKFESEFKSHVAKASDAMERFLETGVGNLFIDINDIFAGFHRVNNSKE
ncbi:Spore wall protein 12 [Cucumispora dikerogammari]|nr:Spore wall protein 12 [Cucumispora dikerogammari]